MHSETDYIFSESKSFQPNEDDPAEMALYNALPSTYRWSDAVLRWYRNAKNAGLDDEAKRIASDTRSIMDKIQYYEQMVSELREAKALKDSYTIEGRNGKSVSVSPVDIQRIRMFGGFRKLSAAVEKDYSSMHARMQTDVTDKFFRLSEKDMKNIRIVDKEGDVVMWATKGFDTTNRFIYRFWGVGEDDFGDRLANDDYGKPDVNSPYCTRVRRHWNDYSKGDPDYEQYWFMLDDPKLKYKKGDLTDPEIFQTFVDSANTGPDRLCAMCGSFNDWCDRNDQDLKEYDLDIFDVDDGYQIEDEDDNGNTVTIGEPMDFLDRWSEISELFKRNFATGNMYIKKYPWADSKSLAWKFMKIQSVEEAAREYDPTMPYNGNITIMLSKIVEVKDGKAVFKYPLPAKINGRLLIEGANSSAEYGEVLYPPGAPDVIEADVLRMNYLPQIIFDFLSTHVKPVQLEIFQSNAIDLSKTRFENLKSLVLGGNAVLENLGNLPDKLNELKIGDKIQPASNFDISSFPKEIQNMYCLKFLNKCGKYPYVKTQHIEDGLIQQNKSQGTCWNWKRDFGNQFYDEHGIVRREVINDYSSRASMLAVYAVALMSGDMAAFDENGMLKKPDNLQSASHVLECWQNSLLRVGQGREMMLFCPDGVHIFDFETGGMISPEKSKMSILLGINMSTLNSIKSLDGCNGHVSSVMITLDDDSYLPRHAVRQPVICEDGIIIRSPQNTYRPVGYGVFDEILQIFKSNTVKIRQVIFKAPITIPDYVVDVELTDCGFYGNSKPKIPSNVKKLSIRYTRCEDLSWVPATVENLEIEQNTPNMSRFSYSGIYSLAEINPNIRKIVWEDSFQENDAEIMRHFMSGMPYLKNIEIMSNLANKPAIIKKIIDAYESGEYFDEKGQFRPPPLDQLKESAEIGMSAIAFRRLLY